MRNSKYKKLILLFVVYIVFWVVTISILEILFIDTIDLSRFFLIDDFLVELGIIFIIIFPLSALIGLFIGGYFISPIVLFLHKKLFGSSMYYGVQTEERSEKLLLFSKSFFPVLMAINLSSLLFTPTIVEFILSADITNIIDTLPMLKRFFADAVLLMITLGISTMLFSSVWFLKDSGIIFSNKQKIENSTEPIVLRSIGEWFQTILRSYAGIGAIITYILVLNDFIPRFVENFGLPENIVNIPTLILWLGLPLILTISLVPVVIVNDILKKRRVRYIRNISTKLGIKDPAIISFEFKKRAD